MQSPARDKMPGTFLDKHTTFVSKNWTGFWDIYIGVRNNRQIYPRNHIRKQNMSGDRWTVFGKQNGIENSANIPAAALSGSTTLVKSSLKNKFLISVLVLNLKSIQVQRKGGETKQRLTLNNGKPYVQSFRPLSMLWHTLLTTLWRQTLFHLTLPSSVLVIDSIAAKHLLFMKINVDYNDSTV